MSVRHAESLKHLFLNLTEPQLALLGSLLFIGGISLLTQSGLGPKLLRHLKFSNPRKNARGVWLAKTFLSDTSRLRHTHIVGATGCGKTVLLERLLFEDLKRGYGAIFIDPKGDRELYERLKVFCKKLGREEDLHLLSSTYQDESVRWNPCRLGNPSELQSKFYNSSIYTEPHYAKACELGLLRAFEALHEIHPKQLTLLNLVAHLEELSGYGKDQTLQGLFLDLKNLALGEWKQILCCGEVKRTQPELSLLSLTRRNGILFVDLPTESKAVQSSRLGRLLLQEILLISGLRKAYPHLKSDRPFSVFIDEFDAFATESFTTFLNKGRSGDFMIHMAHQTLSDLEAISPTFKGKIMGNPNVRFVFRQDDPDDAEEWARLFGTKTVLKSTYQTQDGSRTGLSSNRDAQEFRVSPDAIKEMKVGQCVLSIKTEGVFKIVQIPLPRDQDLGQQPFQREPIQTPLMSDEMKNESQPNRFEQKCTTLAALKKIDDAHTVIANPSEIKKELEHVLSL